MVERKKFLKVKKDVIIYQFGFWKEGWLSLFIFCCEKNKEDRLNLLVQKDFIYVNFCENKGNEKFLFEVFLFIRLLLLYLQKEKMIKDKCYIILVMLLEKFSEENFWNGFENCCYLRIYKEIK